MSTNAGIFREAEDGSLIGTYVHSDGYPTALGYELWVAFHDVFGGDLERMCRTLVDDEPAGWSCLAGQDMSLPAAWSDFDRADRAPQSFRLRGEEPFPLTDLADEEWAYTLTSHGIRVTNTGCNIDMTIGWGAARPVVEATMRGLYRMSGASV